MLKRKKKKKEEEQGSRVRQYVGFRVGEELYGVEIHAVQEIDRMHSVTRLPKSHPIIEGVINVRNHIIPVIDMAKRFGLPPVEVGRRTRIIIARISGETVGLIVEQVTEVIPLEESAIEPPPAMAFAVERKYVDGVGHIKEGLIILLNLDLLLSVEEMSQLRHLS